MEPTKEYIDRLDNGDGWYEDDIRTAYRDGADAQLEKCCEWLSGSAWPIYGRELQAAMRPKPP